MGELPAPSPPAMFYISGFPFAVRGYGLNIWNSWLFSYDWRPLPGIV